jgi:hypothetical protein
MDLDVCMKHASVCDIRAFAENCGICGVLLFVLTLITILGAGLFWHCAWLRSGDCSTSALTGCSAPTSTDAAVKFCQEFVPYRQCVTDSGCVSDELYLTLLALFSTRNCAHVLDCTLRKSCLVIILSLIMRNLIVVQFKRAFSMVSPYFY